jgi:uncharacterized protein YceK
MPMTKSIRAAAMLVCLLSGCASITEAPKLYGGTRALLERPFPITDASIKLGPEKAVKPGAAGLVLLNVYWIVDFPLSFLLDSLLAPLAYWVFDERGSSSSSSGDAGHEGSAPTRRAPTAEANDPNSIPDDPLSPDW